MTHFLTVVGGSAEILPHALAHYQSLGIESFFLHLQLPSANHPLAFEIEQIARRFSATIASVHIGPWLHDTNRALYRQTLAAYADDWFLISDQDELQLYPRDLPSILGECDRSGFDYIEGCFLDRFARNGSFPTVSPTESIWQQFPLAGFVSAPILEANPNKIVAAKGRVELGPGQHFALSGRGCPPEELYIPVHHFKWTAGVLERLAHRIQLRRHRGDRYWEESQRFLDHCRAHNGRLDIADPSFYLAEALPDYAHWPRVSQLSIDLARTLR